MRSVLAVSGYVVAVWWCVCFLCRRAHFQYWWRVILVCVGMCIFGEFFSNVSSVGIGSVSRRSRDVCIVSQRVLALVGCGACFKRANAGASASFRTCAAWSLVRLRYLLVHSMCRWGVFPLVCWVCLWQNGHLSRILIWVFVCWCAYVFWVVGCIFLVAS